jgi:hypothetical protein
MAITLRLLDWQNVVHGAGALRRIYQTFIKLSPTNRPVGKDGIFISSIQTGSGVAQSVAHGLAAVPDKVIAVPVGSFNGIATDISYGTHTTTNVVVTVPNGLKYQVLAILT